MWQWSLWETDRLDRQITTDANHTTALPEAQRDKSIADAAWAEIEPAFEVLNAALGKAPWLAGDVFTIADLNVGGALFRGVVHGSVPLAGAGRVAHALLGPPGSEEGPRDAGGPGANGLPASE